MDTQINPSRYIFLIIIVSISVFGCYYDSEEYLYPQINNTCDTLNVTYSLSVKPIIELNCLSCHGNTTAAAFGSNIKLENYTDIKLRVDVGKLLGSVQHNSGYSFMPKDAAKLDECYINIIKIWIEENAPNN